MFQLAFSSLAIYRERVLAFVVSTARSVASVKRSRNGGVVVTLLVYNKVTFEQGKSVTGNSFKFKYIENSFSGKFGLNVNKGLSR